MERSDIWAIARRQLALDYSCRTGDLGRPGVTLTEAVPREGRRIYAHDGCMLKVLCTGAAAVLRAKEEMAPWIRENLMAADPAWLFEYPALRRLDRALHGHGERIADIHQYFLPIGDGRRTRPAHPVRWHEAEDILKFEGDMRFGQAFVFGASFPNVLAVAAMDGEKVMGMAGASADGALLWQIGIDVLPAYRGQGIGANLTALLAEEIMRRGRVPFYGTVQSHILSQRVAVQAGFLPAWVEAHTETFGEQDPSVRGEWSTQDGMEVI